jgi:hypothetical protein
MPENGQGHREAVLTKNQGHVSRVLEEAARWGQQGAESARWTLNNDIISTLTILHVFALDDAHLILLLVCSSVPSFACYSLCTVHLYIYLDPCLNYAPCYSFPLAQSSELPRT